MSSIKIDDVINLAKAAGDIHMHYYQKDNIAVNYKQDSSPVSVADIESNNLICNTLAKLYPNIPIISEENHNPDIDHDIFWSIDPLDGTKSFLNKKGEFTVNIGLVCNREPVMGVVYASLSNQLYYTAGDKIAYKQGVEKINAREVPNDGAVVLTSVFFTNYDMLNEYLKNIKLNKIVQTSSALKICLIAEGLADLYPRFGQTMEWDTAAGHAILNAAGGSIKDFEGNHLSYGHQEREYYNPNFIAKGK
jgi:3'(2'), 5'-bisphosphate nucleotidase